MKGKEGTRRAFFHPEETGGFVTVLPTLLTGAPYLIFAPRIDAKKRACGNRRDVFGLDEEARFPAVRESP